MLSSSPDTFKHSWFSVKKFQTIHLSTTGTYKLNRYPVGEKKMHGNIFKDITFLVAYQWNLILPFVTYWALFVLQTKQSLYAFACFCRLKPLRKHCTVGQLQEGESNLKDIYPVQSCPFGQVKKLLELTEPLFYLGKAPILWSTDVDKMGLFLMGPAHDVPMLPARWWWSSSPSKRCCRASWHRQRASCGVKLRTLHWGWLPKCPQTPQTRGEPLKHGQTSQSLLKFTVKREVDEIKERRMSCGYEKCWLGLSQWGK